MKKKIFAILGIGAVIAAFAAVVKCVLDDQPDYDEDEDFEDESDEFDEEDYDGEDEDEDAAVDEVEERPATEEAETAEE